MRLAIADPPYLGRSRWYSGGPKDRGWKRTNERGPKGRVIGGAMTHPADNHPDAHLWDQPETHIELAQRLEADYDGFAIAMARTSLPVYLTELPTAHVAVWHNPRLWPPGARMHPNWEPVLVHIPEGRRARGSGPEVKDVLTAVHLGERSGFIGAKPAAWTRWVLDMLGYNPDTDTVDDLFPGSGAVAREIQQQVIDINRLKNPAQTHDTTGEEAADGPALGTP